MARIGVFICHCGENIARSIDCAAVAAEARSWPGVVWAGDLQYTCSAPGQELIKNTIVEQRLTAVVIGSCSPRLHSATFRQVCTQAGLNPFLCQIANLREQCAWVHQNREEATAKALSLVRGAVERVQHQTPLSPLRVPITRRALVIGGGIAGVQCALDLAQAGIEVILVERQNSLGGRMAQLAETFPTLDCSQCILTPRLVEAASHPNIRLELTTEVEKLEGFVGNFRVHLRQQPRFVAWDKCTGCGACAQACPQKTISSAFDGHLGTRTAIGLPFPQAVPSKVAIDSEHCLKLNQGKCGICARVCPAGAIDYTQSERRFSLEVGAIVVASGFQVMEAARLATYGGGRHPNVITALQFERLLSASGPTQGQVLRPSDGQPARTIAFIQCAGSRDRAHHVAYCSKICCMYTAKQATLFRRKNPQGQAWVFCMDVRTPGKGYDEFYRRAVVREGVTYLRSRVSMVVPQGDSLLIQAADTLDGGRRFDLRADMVVLASAALPQDDARQLARILGLVCDGEGWFSEAHPKLRPVESNVAGIYLAGGCSGPKDIPESVAQASAAAAKVLGLLSRASLERAPQVAQPKRRGSAQFSDCNGCLTCAAVCPSQAIESEIIQGSDATSGIALTRRVARINAALCQGCGACVAACPAQALELAGFSTAQLAAEIDGLLDELPAP